jgi:hypothetical protein
MDMSIIDGVILALIIIGLTALLILSWRETIDFILLVALTLFVLYLGYSAILGV